MGATVSFHFRIGEDSRVVSGVVSASAISHEMRAWCSVLCHPVRFVHVHCSVRSIESVAVDVLGMIKKKFHAFNDSNLLHLRCR
jgi:hypothetical protein